MNLVIVGAGHAGIRAAVSARQAGFDGRLLLVANDGLPTPYERPPLSKWGGDAGPTLKPIVPEEQLSLCNIDNISGEVVRLDTSNKQLHCEDGSSLSYDKLLIATGAVSRRLPDTLTDGVGIHYLRDAHDASSIHDIAQRSKSAIIVGGGFIGLELATSLRRSELAVHVFESAERLLERAVSPRVARIVQQLHESNGVSLTFNARISKLSRNRLQLENGQVHDADMVIAGIGSLPSTDLAERAGLLVNNGIVVDTQMRTCSPDVFAAGDCVSFPLAGASDKMTRLEAWQAAGDQGEVAGHNMVAESLKQYTAVPWFWSNQYDHVLQVAGLPSPDLDMCDRHYGDDHHISLGQNDKRQLRYACGIAAGNKAAKDIRFASKLISAGSQCSAEDLSSTTVSLKSLI